MTERISRFLLALLGLIILGWTVFDAVPLLLDLPRCLPSPIYLAECLALGSVYFLTAIVGIAFLRGRSWGFWPLYLVLVFLNVCNLLFVPVVGILIPRRYTPPSFLDFSLFALVIFLIVFHRRLAGRNSRDEPLRLRHAIAGLSIVAGSILASYGTLWLHHRAAEAAWRGDRLRSSGQADAAIRVWRTVMGEYPGSISAADAQYSLAREFLHRERYAEARALLKASLQFPPTNRISLRYSFHAGPDLHEVCLSLADCCEATNDINAALEYVRLAQFVHEYNSCLPVQRHHELNERIARLMLQKSHEVD